MRLFSKTLGSVAYGKDPTVTIRHGWNTLTEAMKAILAADHNFRRHYEAGAFVEDRGQPLTPSQPEAPEGAPVSAEPARPVAPPAGKPEPARPAAPPASDAVLGDPRARLDGEKEQVYLRRMKAAKLPPLPLPDSEEAVFLEEWRGFDAPTQDSLYDTLADNEKKLVDDDRAAVAKAAETK